MGSAFDCCFDFSFDSPLTCPWPEFGCGTIEADRVITIIAQERLTTIYANAIPLIIADERPLLAVADPRNTLFIVECLTP
jgi:hypothetical protein